MNTFLQTDWPREHVLAARKQPESHPTRGPNASVSNKQSPEKGRQRPKKSRRLATCMAAVVLFAGFWGIGQLGRDTVVVKDEHPPLSSWAQEPITVENTHLTFPLGSVIAVEDILTASGAKTNLEGHFIVSGLDTLSTDTAGEYTIQLTLQDNEDIALGSLFLTLTISS